MSKFKFIIMSVALAVLCVSCNKSESPASDNSGEIVFNLGGDGIDLNVDTKASATAVTSVSEIYWEASSGSSVVHSVAQYNVSSNKVSTGLYWPSTSASYNYKAANVSFTSGGAIDAANTTDIVAGTASGVTKSTNCTITLNHIFARTGTVTLNTQSGYTLSGVSWKISSSATGTGTKGTYTIGSGWSTSGVTSLSKTTFDGTSDLYLIPGTYSVEVSYTLTKGSYSESFTKTGTVALEAGKINNISATAFGGSASEIVFSVSLTAWSSADKTVTFNS